MVLRETASLYIHIHMYAWNSGWAAIRFSGEIATCKKHKIKPACRNEKSQSQKFKNSSQTQSVEPKHKVNILSTCEREGREERRGVIEGRLVELDDRVNVATFPSPARTAPRAAPQTAPRSAATPLQFLLWSCGCRVSRNQTFKPTVRYCWSSAAAPTGAGCGLEQLVGDGDSGQTAWS